MDMHDIYVLARARSYDYIQCFLQLWPQLEPTRLVYEVPEFGTTPIATFASHDSLIRYLIEHPTERYVMYFQNLDEGDVQYVILFFNEDGGMGVGVSVPYQDDIAGYLPYLRCLANAVDGEYGMVFWEAPPPDNTGEFLQFPLPHANIAL